MARKAKSSLIEDIFEITASLPWWAGTFLAILSNVILHRYAIADDVSNIAVPGQIGHLVISNVTKNLASLGQYILPALFLLAALTSFIKQKKRKNLVINGGESINAIRSLSWLDFELLVGQAFRMNGFSVTETGGGGADGGIDLQLKKDGEIFLVQCKQWRAFKVSVTIVRELYGVMASQGATGGFVVTSGVFTSEAVLFATGRNIELIDGVKLAKMLAKAKESHLNQYPPITPTHILLTDNHQVSCPICGSAMTKRIAKRGSNKGNEFWGCMSFPKCRGVRN